MASPDAAILQEIARISGAINRAKAANSAQGAGDSSSSSAAHSSSSTSRGRYAAYPPVQTYGYHRGAHVPYHHGRGRGYPPIPYPPTTAGPYRGGSHSSQYAHQRGTTRGRGQPAVTRANNTWTPAAASKEASGSRHKTLVLNKPGSKDKSVSPSAGSSSTPLPETGASTTVAEASTPKSPEPSPNGITVRPGVAEADKTEEEKERQEPEEVEMEDGEIDESTLPPPEPKKPPISLIKQGNEIIINGVTFVSDASGRKLVRKDSLSNKLDTKGKGKMADGTETTSTPSKTSIDGQAYVRTKSGNLISTAVLKRRQEMAEKKKRINELVAVAKNVQKARKAAARAQKKKTLCRYFQKTGVCARANTCPYTHDSDKVSICPRFLRNSCPLTSSTCPLSHIPNAHRMPHCQHYPHCKRGDDCPYTHVQVAEDAKICKDFVGLGWCERGEKCTERHVWECPDFEEKGVCNKRGCKLGHVIRRKNAKGANEDGSKLETEPSFMFYDTNPDPSFVRDDSLALPAGARKRSASTSVASAEDYSSGEEEAANLVKKKVKIVEVPVHHKPESKDAMQANEDYVTLVFSDVDDDDEEMLLDEEESEAESGLEEEHLDSISRKIDPTVYDDGPTGEKEDDERTELSSEDEDEDEDDDEANTTIRLGTPAKDLSVESQPQATSSSEATDESDSESD